MAKINEELLDHLFHLAKIEKEHNPQRRQKLLNDLEKILNYFNQLQEVETQEVEPMTGGTFLANVFRKDEEKIFSPQEKEEAKERSLAQFSSKEERFLKTPPVFD